MHKILIRRFVCYLLTLACFALVGASVLLAQGAGTITGVVTDATGAIVPDATVTVTNQATGVKFTAKTNSAGNYVFTAMLPATYSVEVAAKGFRTYANKDLVLNTDQTLRADAALEVGQETQMITVEAAAPLINTSEGRMQNVVSGAQVANMPLNGRNIYELMQLIPGSVNSTQIDMENGSGGIQTNINGNRANFNGFLFDGVSNKGLSGGSNSQPAPDFVQEFVIQTNNFSAEYSSSAGSITDVSTKAGTNQFHGDAWEFFRNDKLNARNFFDSSDKPEWRQNQFGAALGGPIKKNKIFFFGGYEGERFRTASSKQYFMESAGWQSAVESALPNSVAALLYKNFPGPVATSGSTVDDIVNTNVTGGPGDIGGTIGGDYTGTGTNLLDAYLGYTDPCFLSSFVGVGIPAVGSATWGNPQTVANNSAAIFGVTAAENAQITTNIAAGCPGSGLVAPAMQSGAISRSALMEGFINAPSPTRTRGVFYNGDQYTARGDYEGDQNRVSARWFFFLQKDPNPTPFTGLRGFSNPLSESFPGGVISFVHTFSPTVVNEFRFGYTRSQIGETVPRSQYGVPDIGFDSGEPQFGAYNGYPQFFNEDVFNFKDMVSLVKGKHSLKIGGEFKRNYENSEFDVGRPSYYFFDPVYFASDLPYIQASGVNPELAKGPNQGHIDTNIRAWRNYEVGAFIQDDYKVTKNLTLNLGLRWDFFSPHTEKYHKATQLVLGPGDNQVAKIASINCETFLNGTCLLPAGDTQTPNGGFTTASSLFPDRWKNFAPRFGFAWDPFGTGKTSLRGGAALSYEASFYNALSNSRWNLPFYSFNEASPLLGIAGLPTYGPTDLNGNPTGVAPTYSGPPSNVGQGPAGLGFAGNIMGWLPSNPNLAVLTGIPSANYRLPYVEQFFLGVQHQFSPSTVLEVNGVMNLGRRLFWAEDVNRVVGGKQRPHNSVFNPCTGQMVTNPRINPCFGHMRTWETSVNSSYESLQVSLNRRASHGLTYTTAYTWAHSIDLRSTWHALSSAGSATDRNSFGEAGYSLDSNRLFLERGDSLFDIRHRIVGSVQWELPWMKDQHGFAGRVLGGWQVNSVISLQTGFPFTVGCHCDYNGDGVRSDRPDTPSFGNYMYFTHSQFENGALAALKSAFPKPTPGTDGNLGRNTFSGPGFADTDFSLFKKIPMGERFSMQFRAELFNLFNHTNLYPPVANLTDASFGLTQQAFDPRELQFGLKLIF
jgi:carboxypeptidase family protein/TonB-dependent receptor-like protein